MLNRAFVAATLLAAFSVLPAAPVNAAVILITHAKAQTGNVTPGDAAGYPVTISIPGKFQLDSNLFVSSNKIGIQVTSKNVTIDLNGFTLQGSGVAWYGITGGTNAVTIQNGTITQFKFDGINGTGNYWIVDNLSSIENGREGIVLELGNYHRIQDSTVADNGATGIKCMHCVISGNVVASNGYDGIDANVGGADGGATVVGNYIVDNTYYGLIAGSTLGGSGFANNTLFRNNSGTAGTQVGYSQGMHPNICVNLVC
jgi:hypothetical protein